ncbi:MAG: bifunctional DNA-formamidopyrimidine glycosylase/DNA-(apurinic or apyrimidinic site) lyase [Gammaproteobacteria bacterium]|nr:bifunctional DNA-formamidopyrimidine glycosylase/DNA-(apurinic or apyrimidinic site) lyase [Gammaproteobacteria bacterium]MDH3411121.1 bifunctional DNA-formamidopyrimidine glycosylase/DNA-(apurinic or apyrimidinic site) lyase [Gammaproteobacteria bacterium]
MPELPEVETTRRGIEPYVKEQVIVDVEVREPRLRWRVPAGLAQKLKDARVLSVERRGKYLLLSTSSGTLIVHLGMSGSLRMVTDDIAPQSHDHVDVSFSNGLKLRLRDPRRFGSVLWTRSDPFRHPLLASLGPEPLSHAFDGNWLHETARGRRAAVKTLIMNSRVVAGVGNIYASEALFLAGINPARSAGRISARRFGSLADAVKQVLEEALVQGGTTLRDFVNGAGEPGYFAQSLRVYGREGEACIKCGSAVRARVLGQRASYYCPRCQR